jgi:hypothetical protein
VIEFKKDSHYFNKYIEKTQGIVQISQVLSFQPILDKKAKDSEFYKKYLCVFVEYENDKWCNIYLGQLSEESGNPQYFGNTTDNDITQQYLFFNCDLLFSNNTSLHVKRNYTNIRKRIMATATNGYILIGFLPIQNKHEVIIEARKINEGI